MTQQHHLTRSTWDCGYDSLGFARSAGAGDNKRIVLQLDNAGWHAPENLAVPDGVRLVFQPSHSPEQQPAEHLWEFVDEPMVNTYFETIEDLDKAAGERCVALAGHRETIRATTLFHWKPKPSGEINQPDLVVRAEGAECQWRKVPSRELPIDPGS